MELCIKTLSGLSRWAGENLVSILVLMELCIKTETGISFDTEDICFNPCFNGTMYKNGRASV